MLELAQYRLGVSSDDIVLQSSQDNQQVALALAQQASLHIDIFSHDLEPRLYDNTEFAEAIKSFVLKGNHARVRVLVTEPDYVNKNGHRFIQLSRQLTSYMELRKTHEDYTKNPAAFLLADQRGLVYRSMASHYAGIANFNAPLKVAELLQFFDAAWNHSRQYTEFRRLYI
jgi:hypothetical protein